MIDEEKGCSEYRGCKGYYCWAYCGVSLKSGEWEWCYTTKSGNSVDDNYVTCTTEEHCSKCWRCAARCTVLFFLKTPMKSYITIKNEQSIEFIIIHCNLGS